MNKLEEREVEAAGLLEASGVFGGLRVACRLLTRTDQALIRATTLSIPTDHVNEAVADLIRRYAEEQCLVAQVEQRDRRLVIRLQRTEEGAE